MFYATQRKLLSLKADLIAAARDIITEKLYPLRGYLHLENSKLDTQTTLEQRFAKPLSSISTMLAIWQLRSRANREQKENEQQEERTKRLNIKWNSWNALTKKRNRL